MYPIRKDYLVSYCVHSRHQMLVVRMRVLATVVLLLTQAIFKLRRGMACQETLDCKTMGGFTKQCMTVQLKQDLI